MPNVKQISEFVFAGLREKLTVTEMVGGGDPEDEEDGEDHDDVNHSEVAVLQRVLGVDVPLQHAAQYDEFALPYQRAIVDEVRRHHPTTPVVLYARGDVGVARPAVDVQIHFNRRARRETVVADAPAVT